MAPPSPPPASPTWVILSTVPRISAADDLQPGADLSLAVAAPPRITHLSLAPRVSPARPDPHASLKFPYILAADPSGLLLTVTPPPASPTPALPTTAPRYGVVRIDVTDIPRPGYFVLDVPSAAASRVPDPGRRVFNWANLGVIAATSGGYMLAEFQSVAGYDEATLLCFSSETGEWVDNPRPSRTWNIDGIVSHDGKLWWVDRAKGLLVCDPFADLPDMVYVSLSDEDGDEDSDDDGHGSCYCCSERQRASRRYVQVSDGKFRCVEVSCAHQDKGGAPTVTMRTLADPETPEWTLEYEVTFAEIWASDIYKAVGLPEMSPVVALIHPKNPDVVYFFVKDYLFGVDMHAKAVVKCEAQELAGPSSNGSVSPSGVLAWELPPALTAGLSMVVCDSAVKEE